MKIFKNVLSFLSLSMAVTSLSCSADEHGGVHIKIPTCEGVLEEEGEKTQEVCWELKPWYSHQHFEEYENIETKSEHLQDDTAWPGQREDFSDYLMR